MAYKLKAKKGESAMGFIYRNKKLFSKWLDSKENTKAFARRHGWRG